MAMHGGLHKNHNMLPNSCLLAHLPAQQRTHLQLSGVLLNDAAACLDMLMVLCRLVHRLHLTNLRSTREWQWVWPIAISDLPCGHKPE